MSKNIKGEIEEVINTLLIPHEEDEDGKQAQETPEEYLKYIDSIRFIELITAIESKYDIEISTEDLLKDNKKDLDTFVAMVEKYLK